jgi:hypothetical protein
MAFIVLQDYVAIGASLYRARQYIRLTESSTVRFPEVASEDVDDKMSEIISRLSVDWSTVSFAALTTLPSSFIMRPAVSAVIVSYKLIM